METARDWSWKSRDAAGNVRENLDRAKDKLTDVASNVASAAQERTSAVMSATESYIARYPYTSVAIAVALGLLAGALMANSERVTNMTSNWRRSSW